MGKIEQSHTNVLQDISDDQKADRDGRIKAREADHFVNKKDGQWEPKIVKMYSGKPRYTIDLTSGIVADVSGEMNSMDFDIKVSPAGGPATTDIALHYDGLIRNIENNSPITAKYIYRAAGKQMITTGIGGWGIKSGYRNPMSFDQDLMIYPISNFMDRVWFDANAELQDMSDAYRGVKFTNMSMQAYKKDFPKGSGASVANDRDNTVYSYKKTDSVTIAQYYYKKAHRTTLVMMTNGAVYQVNDDFNKVKDELSAKGVTVDRERETTAYTVYQQTLDGDDFLTDSEETVFSYIPLVPCFGNFEISEDKVIYWGVVEKHMDPQRILNYAESRKISEGALAPRAKKWMTKEQATGYQTSLQTMNTNDDPVQFYNHVPDQPIPFETGGAQINPGLKETTESMNGYMQQISGRMDPSSQGFGGLQSGIALEALQNKGDNAFYGYFISMEIALGHTYRVCKDAIPKTYDAKREVQLDFQDGTNKTITINESIYDEQSGKVIDLNDFSKGEYSVVAEAGPAFHNRQQETITAINEVAAIDPTIMQTGGDIYLANIPAPGMNKIAKRKRAQMLKQGMIPPEEMTDEEKQQMQAAQAQPQQPSAMDQALLATAQAETETAQAKTKEAESKALEREQKIELQANKMLMDDKNRKEDRMLDMMKEQNNQIKTLADTLKTLKDSMGVDAIVTPANTEAYNAQARKTVSAINETL